MNAGPKSLLYRFRPMTLEDVSRVHEIDVLSFSMPWTERSYRFELTENRHAVPWVVEIYPADAAQAAGQMEYTGAETPVLQAEIVGMIVTWVIIDEAHVATIAIHPDHRGQGLGRKLLALGLLAAYERGARLAYLEVRRSNQVAQTLYHQFGFYVAGERLRYYQDNNEDALLMTLDPIKPDLLRQFAQQL